MARNHEFTAERFLKDVEHHQMTVLQDEGVYRHIRFSDPDEPYCQWFDLITWPGGLCYTGDMGTYVFRRLHDMFEFFRRDPKQPELFKWIDRRYWAEKIEARDRAGVTEFCEEKFNRAVLEMVVRWMREHRDGTSKEERRELWDEVVRDVINAESDSGGYRKQCAAHDFHYDVRRGLSFYLRDFWEVNVERYTLRFDWCCYALRWGIEQYDQAKAAAKVEEVAHA